MGHQRTARWIVAIVCALSLGAATAVLAQPVPQVSLGLPAEGMLGEPVSFTVTFDNASTTDTGYGPIIDLVFPVNGADGAAGTDTPDGLSFVSATYLGAAVTAQVLTFPDDGGGTGCVDHPYLVDTNHTPFQVCGTAGDQLVVLRLPFGSVVPDQPAITVDVSADMSNLADLGDPLPVSARGAFMYGADPLDNPCCDPVIVSDTDTDSSTWPSASVTPTVLRITKSYISPDTLGTEDEITVGPAYPRQYRVTVDIADGQTVTNLDLTDVLPDSMQFVSLDQTLVHGSPVSTTAVSTPSTSTPGGTLTRRFASVTGDSSAADAEMIFTFYVPRVDAGGAEVIPAGTCATPAIDNNASASGSWTPVDPRDTGGAAASDPAGPEHTVTAKTLPVQKAVALVNDVGASGYSPGDTLEYTLEFQVSDPMAFDALKLTDIISDGQRFDTGFTPTIEILEHGTHTGPAAFSSGNFTVTDHYTGAPSPATPIDGTQELEFRVSDEMVSQGLDAVLLGSCVPAGGTGGGAPDCSVFSSGETKVIVRFRSVIQENFTDDYPSGDASVDQGDVLSDSVTVEGGLLDPTDLSSTGQTCSDGSSATVSIARGSISKELYAINGSTTLPSPLEIFPGDTVTYRIRYTLPTSDFEDLSITDFLPLPVFDATEVTSFSSTVDGTAPAAGTAKYGPADTFHNYSGMDPTLSTDAGANSIIFAYGSFDSATNASTEIDLLFTVTVTTEPFADGLYLTNLAQAQEGATNAASSTADAIVQIELREPYLAVRKGVCSTDNPDEQFTPPLSGGSCPGQVTSNDLDGDPALSDSDVSGVDVGDTVTFSMVIENQGGSGAFDISIHDVMPPGFCLPGCTPADPMCAAGAAGLNLSVVRGDGFTPTWTPRGSYNDDRDLFSNGLMLDDSGGQPLCQPHDPAAGTNTLTVTYELQVCDPTLVPEALLSNQSGVNNYAGEEGGPSHVDPTNPSDFTDSADTTLASPQLAKTLVGTGINDATNAANEAVIGETVTYQLFLTVPEGEMPSAHLLDTLDRGLAFVQVDSVSYSSSDLTSDNTIGTGTAPANVTVTNSGRNLDFDFGTIYNVNRDNSVDETITIVYTAVLLNQSRNQQGRHRNNSATVTWSTGSVGPVSAPNIRIIEPSISITKTASPIVGDAGDTITYTIDLSSAGGGNNADAQDVAWTDTLPTGLSYVAGSLSTNGCSAAPALVDSGAPILTATWGTFPAGGSCQLTYQATVDTSVNPDETLPNTAAVEWTSLPGNPGQISTYSSDSTERDGSGGVNDYIATGTAQVTVGSPQVTKVVASTSESFTGADQHTAGIPDLTIGETATFDITITLPEGTTPQVVITDSLPANATGVMEYVSSSVISVGANLAPATNPPTVTVSDNNLSDGIDDTVVFDFGQVVNNPDGVQDANDRITVRVTARLKDVPNNSDGNLLTNTALLQYGSGLQASGTAQVEVVAPALSVSKTASPTTGDSGDTVTFTVTVDHGPSSTADAFDLVVTDVIPPDMTYAGNVQSLNGPAPVVDASGDPTITFSWDDLAMGAGPYTFSFDVTLNSSVAPDQVILNTADLTYDTLPADDDPEERDHSGSDGATVTVTSPGVDKTVTDTSVAQTGNGSDSEPDLTIGEQVTYTVTVTVPEGTSSNATIVDNLPTAPGILEVVSSQITAMDSDMTSTTGLGVGSAGTPSDSNGDSRNDTVTFDFGTLVNGVGGSNTITLQVVAVVPDVPANQGGLDGLVNTASFTHSGGNPVQGTAAVDLVAPVLTVNKVVQDPASPFGDAGDTIAYRITVAHAPSSSADAFDVALDDLIPAGETYVMGSLEFVDGPPPTEDTSGLPGSVVFGWSTIALADSPVVFEYQVTLDADVLAGQTYTNTANLSWDTLPSSAPGDGGPNDRVGTDSDSADITVNAPALVKVTGVTTLSDTGQGQHNPTFEDLAIGEEVTYEITITVPEGVTQSALVTDALQADGNGVLEAIGATVVSIGGNLTTTQPGTPAFADNALADGLNDTVTFDFGDITNTADGAITDADRIVLEVTARVVDVSANTDADDLVNYAGLSYATGPVVDDTADVDVVEPAMAVSKTLGTPTNGVVPITVVLTNNGTAPAYDINVTDLMPSATWDTTSIAPVSIPTGFTFSVTGAPGDATVTMASDSGSSPPASSVEPAEAVTFVFQAGIVSDEANPAANPITNTAVNDQTTTLPGPDPDERDEPDVQDQAQLSLPSIELDKSWSIAPGGDLDGSGTPSPGDVLRYSITVTNGGAGAATNLAVTDPINDPNLTLVPGTVTTGSGTVTTGNGGSDTTVRVDYASFAGNSLDTITYDVQVANPVASGVTTLTNWASGDCDELPAEPSNDPSTPADDDPTVVPLDAAPDIAVTKDDSVTEARPGDTLTYTITVSNVGNQNATGVVLTDTVPAGTAFVSASDGGTESTGTVTWPAFNLAAGASVQRTLILQVDDPAPVGQATVDNTASASDDGNNGTDLNPNNNSGTDSDQLIQADLAVTKTDSPDPVRAGEQVTYTISVTNNGPAADPSVTLTDTLPSAFTFVSAVPAQGSCSQAGGVVTCILGSLAASAGTTVTVVCDVPSDTAEGTYTNNASVTGGESDPDTSNNSTTEDTTVTREIDLGITKSDSPDPVTAGEELTWTLDLVNNGPSDATGVTVTDTLPAGVTFVSASSGCTEAGGTVTCAVGDLAAADTQQLQIVVTVDPSTTGTLSNSASITGDQTDTDSGNDSDDEDTTVTTSADLSVVKDGPATVNRGGQVTYTVTVTNNGPSDALNVSLSDPTPGGLSFVSADAPCAGGFPCALGTLAAGGSVSLNATYDVPSDYSGADPLVNTASVSSDTPDQNPDDNSDDAASAVDRTPQCDLAVTKTGPPSAALGSTVTYTLAVTNNGPDGAENVSLDDPTPAGLTFVSADAPCAGGFPCALGTLDPGDTATIHVTFQIPAGYTDTQIDNTASVSTDTQETDTSNNSDSATTPIGAETVDLTVDKEGPTAANPGDPITYTITVTNLGPGDATGVTATDTFPGDVTWVSDTCGNDFADGIWNIGALAAGDAVSCEITAQVAPSAAGPQTNSVVVSGNEPDGDSSNNSDDVVTGIGAEAADVAVTKAGPARTYPGSQLSYTITVTNNGPGTAASVQLADPTPTGLTFLSASAPCSGGLPCTLGDMSAGSAATLTVTFQVPTNYSGPDPIVNRATVSTTSQDTDAANDSDDATTDYVPEADVSIVKDDGQTTVVPGTGLVYTIVVQNAGPGDVVGATVTDTFPAALTGVSWTCTASAGSSCSASGAGNIADTVNILPGGTLTYTVNATVVSSATGTLTNTATVDLPAGMTDPDPSDNSDDDVDTLTPETDLALVKTDSADPVLEGTDFNYILDITNNGPSDATGVAITDPLPAGVTFVSAAPSQGSCSEAGGTVTCALGGMTAGATAQVQIQVTVDWNEPGPLFNSASVTGDQTDPDSSNNDDDEETDTLYTQLDSLKTVSPPEDGQAYRPGEVVTWTIVTTNSGNANATSAMLNDPLPVGVTYIPGSITLDGVPLTDAADSDAGSYDSGTNAVSVDIATVAGSGGSRTVTFQTRLTGFTGNPPATIANQATVDTPGGPVPSDDPETGETDDPTVITVESVPGIPALQPLGTGLLVLLLALGGLAVLRRLH